MTSRFEKEQAEIKAEYELAQWKVAVLAKCHSLEELFDYLFGHQGALSKKQLNKRAELAHSLSRQFRFSFSQVLDEKLLDHRLIETSNYLQDGLPSFRSTVQFKTMVNYHGHSYDVVWTLTPSFTKRQGSYWRVPLRLHEHERMLFRVVSVTSHLNPMIEVNKQYHRDNCVVQDRVNSYYRRYLAPSTWYKIGIFNKQWVMNLYVWQLYFPEVIKKIIDAELAKFGWCKLLAIRRAYLRALDQIQHGNLLDYDEDSLALKEFVHRNVAAAFLDEPSDIKQMVVQAGMQSNDFLDYVESYQQDLDYLLVKVFGYQLVNWEKPKLVISGK